MRILELFSGTASFSNVARARGHECITVDNDRRFGPDICMDVLKIEKESLGFFDFVWASPPCTCFSVASIGRHWTGGKEAYIPSTNEARISIALVCKTVDIIEDCDPSYYLIENPRGVLRKLDIIDGHRDTAWYCQYGDIRAKPTDIWHNMDGFVFRKCHNGVKDHQEARRGAKTGTQGLKDSIERSKVPPMLCNEVLDWLEDHICR